MRGALVLLAVAAGFAATATLSDGCAERTVVEVTWAPSPDAGVAKYVVYRGTAPDVFTEFMEVADGTSAEFPAKEGSRQYFAVQAVDANGTRSPLSAVTSLDATAEVTQTE